ncbi:MAG: AbrB/MazE/SpoVT family DNA-binding domain-containing protein [Chloroflexi bacterium]|nr:AbrB/MazE/SpoVT family DNA-binding domain-containing protein [Chloroflexota bacterium]
MRATLSSKGQVVIPRAARQALGLRPGARFDVRITDDAIVLKPVVASPIDRLYGKFAGSDMLSELEEEHRREIERDAALRP